MRLRNPVRGLAACNLSILAIALSCGALTACRQAPRPTKVAMSPLEATTLVSLLNSLDPVPVISWINPSLIDVTVDISDVLNPTLGSVGPGVPNRVRIVIAFRAFSALSGTHDPVRFNSSRTSVVCHGDYPVEVTLTYRNGRYSGELPRGRVFRERLPNYYVCELHAGSTTYTIATVPVVDPLDVRDPRASMVVSSGADARITFYDPSWSVLWDNTNPDFQFIHEDLAVITERRPDGTLHVVNQSTVPGVRSEVTIALVTSTIPLPTPGNAGTFNVITRYRSTDRTAGVSDFLLREWTSSAGFEVPVSWI